MTSLLPSQLFFIFLILSVSKASHHLPSLLSLNCTPPQSHNNLIVLNNKHIQLLFYNLTYEVTTRRTFAAKTINFGQHYRFNGLVQCRSSLTPATCTQCAQNAKHTITTMCPNSEAATAWFDGCYIQYFHTHIGKLSNTSPQNSNISCSNQPNNDVVDRVQFELALETLLLRLRADVILATHLKLSSGELKYGNNSTVYGLAECVRLLSPKECEACVGESIEKLHEYCGGTMGGIVVNGYCMARFESYRFLLLNETGGGSDSGDGSSEYGGGSVAAVSNGGGGSGGCMGFKLKVGLVWGIVVACLGGVVFSAWLLRRSVINTAKVATFGGADGEN